MPRTLIETLRALFGFPATQPERSDEIAPIPIAAPPAPDISILDERLPAAARQKVNEIRALLAEIDQQADSRLHFEEKLQLDRLKTNHLPRLLQSYVDIPPDHRSEIFRETGHSASYLLGERLDKILVRLRETSRQLARGNLNAFAENIRFVDGQYGGSSSPFD